MSTKPSYEELDQRVFELEVQLNNHKSNSIDPEKLLPNLETIFQVSTDYIAIVDKQGRFKYINRTKPDITKKELYEKTIYDYLDDNYTRITKKAIKSALKKRTIVRFEVYVEQYDEWYLNSLIALQYQDEYDHLMFISKVITLEKKNEIKKLTRKERQVCNMIKANKTAKQISDELGVSQKTVEVHSYNVRKKLGLLNKDIRLKSFLKNNLKYF